MEKVKLRFIRGYACGHTQVKNVPHIILTSTVYHRIYINAVVTSHLDTVCKPWTRQGGKMRLQFGTNWKADLTYFFNIGSFSFRAIDAASGRSALALTFSMVPRTRHTKGEQNAPLLLPPKPNRGKANLASRIRTIEKSPRRTRPFAWAPQLPRRPIKSQKLRKHKGFWGVPKIST